MSGVPRRWIVSARQDLLWIHGSVLAGVALLWLLAGTSPLPADAPLAHPALLAVLAWGVLFDGTHVLGTYARSYCAKDAASRAGLPGAWSWGLLAVGPVLACWRAAFPFFLLGASLWAYYHLVRQHWGFVALYRRRDALAGPEWLDSGLLWLGALHPYLRFALGPAYERTGLPALLPAATSAAGRRLVDLAAFLLALGLVAAWCVHLKAGRLRAGPQHMLIVVVAAFHAAVFAVLEDLLPITATLTIFHNLQYHRIVWHHEAGHGRRPLGGWLPYLGAGVLLGIAWYGVRVAGVTLAGPSLLGRVLLGLGWGVALHHYLVDGRIWRVRRQPGVAAALDAATALGHPAFAAAAPR